MRRLVLAVAACAVAASTAPSYAAGCAVETLTGPNPFECTPPPPDPLRGPIGVMGCGYTWDATHEVVYPTREEYVVDHEPFVVPNAARIRVQCNLGPDVVVAEHIGPVAYLVGKVESGAYDDHTLCTHVQWWYGDGSTETYTSGPCWA